jgi:ribosomal protein L10
MFRPTARRCAISVKPPVVYPRKTVPRIFSEKKTFLYNKYLKILNSSQQSPLLFLTHTDFNAKNLIALRSHITNAHQAQQKYLQQEQQKPTLSMIRTGIFGVALRDFPSIPIEESAKLASWLQGPLALLYLPLLHPPHLAAILKAIDRAVPQKRQEEEARRKQEADKNADPETPGRKVKKRRPVLYPKLALVGALIDGRMYATEQVREIANSPPLGTLRAQLIGLLRGPSVQLAALLNEAGGGKLVRTLEGLKPSLAEEL